MIPTDTTAGVAYAAIGIVFISVGALIWIVKFLMVQMRHSLDRNAEAHLKVAKATDKNTRVTQETLVFMQALNGKLGKITKQTVDEQEVKHQTIAKTEVKKRG